MPATNSEICRRTLLLIASSLVPVASAFAQTTDAGTPPKPCTREFEVATIKPHPAGDMTIAVGGPPGKYEATNASAKLLVEEAFNLPADQVSGGPPWVESQRFDINAKISDDCWQQLHKLHNEDQEKATDLMLQTLLKERLQLSISHHPKELTVYALVVAKGGPKLRPAGSPEQKHLTGVSLMATEEKDAEVSDLARFLSGFLRRTVVDRTGLTGRYDISFAVPIPEDRSPDASTTALLQALEDQLGLKLVSRKEVVDTIVIDHLEQPSEN